MFCYSFLGLGVFNRESTRALLTQDRLDQATQFVHDAMDKYRELQGRLGRTAPKDKVKKVKEEEAAEAREGKNLRRPLESNNDIKESSKESASEPKKNSLEDKWADYVQVSRRSIYLRSNLRYLLGVKLCRFVHFVNKIFNYMTGMCFDYLISYGIIKRTLAKAMGLIPRKSKELTF